jgi:hypothetical protein
VAYKQRADIKGQQQMRGFNRAALSEAAARIMSQQGAPVAIAGRPAVWLAVCIQAHRICPLLLFTSARPPS